jgi:ApbE superfamily uncharacterized protein (UPF0280 family)
MTDRLHLQHGPIDLICRAWGAAEEVEAAYAQASLAFAPVLGDLCAELKLLRAMLPAPRPAGPVARAMHDACAAHCGLTPMAAVAGAVADHVLVAMCAGRDLTRAFVNNGGDIALHAAPGHSLRIGLVADLAAPGIDGVFAIDRPMGLATSGRACKGRGGRSFSFGIADAVTVLAADAATADAAATVIGNAVDLPAHPAITRRPACDIDPDSDLGARLVTWDVGPLSPAAVDAALAAGQHRADVLVAQGLIHGAALVLRGRAAFAGAPLRLPRCA